MSVGLPIFGLVGAGGFSREVFGAAMISFKSLFSGSIRDSFYFVETQPSSPEVFGVPIISVRKFAEYDLGPKFFNIAIGAPLIRKKIAGELEYAGAVPVSIRAKSAEISDYSNIHDSGIFCSNSVVTVGVRIGKFVHLNIGSIIAHDCQIGDFVTIAPNVSCNGNVFIGDRTYVGSGAQIRNGSGSKPLVIGNDVTIGMGAVILKDVPDNSVIVGNPGKILKNTL